MPNSHAPDWWPAALRWFGEADPLAQDLLTLAEITQQEEGDGYRHVYSALGASDVVEGLVSTDGFGGHDVQANGPHPSAGLGEYEPVFSVFADGVDTLEPLVLSWDCGTRIALAPDPGFLMTYGLVPRLTAADQITHWDDPQEPQSDVVVVSAVASTLFDEASDAWVRARLEVVQDYASLRGLSVAQVYLVEDVAPLDAETEAILGDSNWADMQLPGRSISFFLLADGNIKVSCYGIRELLQPGPLPVTDSRWAYPDLQWPGFPRPISREEARSAGFGGIPGAVFVRDTVLGDFEGNPEYSISPELGAVTYRNQWGVSTCQRVGRDLIRVDLKRLYESARPSVVEHYHAHSVPAPNRSGPSEPSVASQSRRITYALTSIGEAVASIVATHAGHDVSPERVVGLSRGSLDYEGWWQSDIVERITRHIPPNLSRDGFLDRCVGLDTLIADTPSERELRRALTALGVDPASISSYKSLKLLDKLWAMGRLIEDTGLDLLDDRDELNRRLAETEGLGSPGQRLQLVNRLRQYGSHSFADKDAKVLQTLVDLGISTDYLSEGFDAALHDVYRIVAESLEEIADTIQSCT